MLIKKPADIRPSEITSHTNYVNRREFLKGGALAGGSLIAGNALGAVVPEGEFAKLPDVQRVIISLVAVEGYTYRETAEILGLPIGTIMSRLSRARSALAEEFDNRQMRH